MTSQCGPEACCGCSKTCEEWSCSLKFSDGFCWSAYCSDNKIHKGQTRDIGSGQENACGGCHSNTGPGQMSQALLTNSITISRLRLTQHTHTSIIFSSVKHVLFILPGTRWFISGWSIMSFFSSRTIFFFTISISCMWFLKNVLWEKLFANNITGKKLTFRIKNLYNRTTKKNKLPSQKMDKIFELTFHQRRYTNSHL